MREVGGLHHHYERGAGTLRLDLRRKPTNDYSVRVTGGAGEATLYLPKDVGVSAKASGGRARYRYADCTRA